jgi:hypothetical protein
VFSQPRRSSVSGLLDAALSLNRRLFKAYYLKEQIGRLWSYTYEGAAQRFFEAWVRSLPGQAYGSTTSATPSRRPRRPAPRPKIHGRRLARGPRRRLPDMPRRLTYDVSTAEVFMGRSQDHRF